MRYMLLIYSKERPEGLTPEQGQELSNAHRMIMEEASRRGVLESAEPLATTSTATTVRIHDGKVLVVDGPFAETKEQLAGYYILDCKDLDEALDWAAKIPTQCKGSEGCVEVRPLPGVGRRREATQTEAART